MAQDLSVIYYGIDCHDRQLSHAYHMSRSFFILSFVCLRSFYINPSGSLCTSSSFLPIFAFLVKCTLSHKDLARNIDIVKNTAPESPQPHSTSMICSMICSILGRILIPHNDAPIIMPPLNHMI
ncbi:hypothetical protein ACN38_g12958 [Penicillium nordicum]|uniref:Uncharacterized protein n=1 Tax=Penicillium nordicum TaxID=229535 RepID=A0A0M8NXH5_9EURO|nr:hypothetical protein ACN38_g12958 [Penicillium nordicum]